MLASEQETLTKNEYEHLKELVMRSAHDFNEEYHSIPKKLFLDIKKRPTFYGTVFTTPKEMYVHTNDVTNYYFGELGIHFENLADIVENRKMAFAFLEQQSDYLEYKTVIGNHGEVWTLKKVLRRCLWHDVIHAKAMYRLAIRNWDTHIIKNPFYF